jgi:hypothetical protein
MPQIKAILKLGIASTTEMYFKIGYENIFDFVKTQMT